MNTYSYEQIELGHKECFAVVVTKEMMQSFFEITHDSNPLHTDESFAQTSGFSGGGW